MISREKSGLFSESVTIERPIKVSEYFGINTFNDTTMQKMVSEKTFRAFKRWQTDGVSINADQADEIANAMKEWALSKGASSYTHWFQPMTGQTAEKHDSFISVNGTGQVMEKFTGSKLIQGEPDASSFPSGGLRVTFEARGYTAWDPSSPAFIIEVEGCNTLCIPTIFISYTGEALDKKLPLLRSDQALSKAAVNLLKLFGHSDVKQVRSTCGAEQEYFLIDQEYYNRRTDLQLAGRTLIGAPSPKGQQLEDQYFGSIKERMLKYMNEVSTDAYKLGIPVITRHNEVAPHQFEFAPMFEFSNIAADHNQLLMDIMRKVAKRHNLECLLHEKPFAGINGSGKHCNWSLADDKGNNLLNPSDVPEDNLQFLTFLVATIQAVHRYASLLRASVASAGNEHRLGANEAPPAIISVYLGEHLAKIIENVEGGKRKKVSKKDIVDFGIGLLPRFPRDTTDRNRTSPFAFTGNKFEFRAVGSSFNVSTALTVINTIVTDSLIDITARITKELKGSSFEDAVMKVLGETIKKSKAILFEGNNYSAEWHKEAAKRGLGNEPSTAGALKALINEDNIKLFERHGIFSRSELTARYNIWLDIYNKVIDIEARTLLEMVTTEVLPGAYNFQHVVSESLRDLKEMSEDETIKLPLQALQDRKEMFGQISTDIYYIRKNEKTLVEMLEKAEAMHEDKRAIYYYDEIKPQMAHIRKHVDNLESIMPEDKWVLPKYKKMLFIA